jgi:hypothetical protein
MSRARILLVVTALAVLLALGSLDRARAVEIEGGVPWVSLYDEPASVADKLIIRGDGQFFAMLARDPTMQRPEVLRTDDPAASFAYRAMRPGYGWMAWAASAGQPDAVSWALLALTVASTLALAAGVLDLCESLGRDQRVALVVVVLPGVVRLLGWTGPEIAAAACACFGVAAAVRGRAARAVGFLLAAALLRETLLLVALGLRLAGHLRKTWWLPFVAVAAWVILVRIVLGAWPSGEGRFELGGIFRAIDGWGVMGVWSFALLVVLVVLGVRGGGRLAWALVLVHLPLALTMGESPWSYDGFSRVFLPLMALLLALASPPADPSLTARSALPAGSEG